MSSAVFPTLSGLGWPVNRKPMWKTGIQVAASGKEVRTGYWTYPRWQWDLTFTFLRSDLVNQEFQSIVGFFNLRQGRSDSFLYEDNVDYTVSDQALGTGDGTTQDFQMVRAFGGFTEPVLAPKTVGAVYLDGLATTAYSVGTWGSSIPGILTMTTPPDPGIAVTADFTFYFPVRFTEDQMDLSQFVRNYWEAKTVSWISIK